MADVIYKARKARILAKDLSLPKWQWLLQGLQAFSGLELSANADHVAEKFEADLAGLQWVLARYSLAEEDGNQNIDDADLQQMLDTLDMAAAHAMAGELDRIVADL